MALKIVTMPMLARILRNKITLYIAGVNEMLQLLCKIVWQQKTNKQTKKTPFLKNMQLT